MYKVCVNEELTPSTFTRTETVYTHAVLTDDMPERSPDDLLSNIAVQEAAGRAAALQYVLRSQEDVSKWLDGRGVY